jgi:formylglycine-generating enzyme required for sulfatase activity
MTAALAVILLGLPAAAAEPRRTARIPAGVYMPLYPTPAERQSRGRAVAAFELDTHRVTNGEFLEFVRAHPEWQRSRVKRIFAERSYLQHWKGDLELGAAAPASSPVIWVSWFAARAYLSSQGEQLPTTDQWEYVASLSPRTRHLKGLDDFDFAVQEWVLDFNAALITGESRADSALDRGLYCGTGASGASNVEDYPAFMRFALRNSLDGRYALATLGVRGARVHSETKR